MPSCPTFWHTLHPTFWRAQCRTCTAHVANEKRQAMVSTQRSLPWHGTARHSGTAARGALPGWLGDGGLILPF